MQNFIVGLLLSVVSVPVFAQNPAIGVATNPEKETPFKDLAECEKALIGSSGAKTDGTSAGANSMKGSLFNRRAGNISVCKMVHGEPQVVVYPKGAAVPRFEP
jgi:hypothetical protein